MKLSDRTQTILLAVVALILLVIIVVQLVSRFGPPNTFAGIGSQDQMSMTLEPEIVANLTAMPQATALSGEAGAWVGDLEEMIAGCAEYSPERRAQMEQHMAWLENPSDIPPDIRIALGQNPPGQLVFGMATYTSIQWRLNERPSESCLIPIGRLLNDMLVALGEPPFSIYDEASN